METWFPGGTPLSAADYLLLLALLGGLIWLGIWAGRGSGSTSDFFLGRRRIPWWAACLSFISTEISAMTIIGVPATAYRENWEYAQFFIGSASARVVIAFLFIPAFYHYNVTTIYEFLKHRFGPATQYSATIFFFITRLFASGVRLMAACVAVSVLLGWHIVPVIVFFTAVSIVYIGIGGIRAVIWTNVMQAATFVAAGLATFAFLAYSIDGGIGTIYHVASAAGRLKLWNWGPSVFEPSFFSRFFSDPNILWIAVLNGFFTSMAAFGTDHELMQRLLTVETRKESQRTMLYTIGVSFFVTVLFLSIGTLLYVFYVQHPELQLPDKLDKIYPHFTIQVMPAFLRGLVLSAIVMASIDSPLASISASFVTDIYRPLIKKDAPDEHYLMVSRVVVLVAGLMLGYIAYVFSFYDKMLWLAFKIGGVTYGSLLGVFLLGLLTDRKSNWANIIAMSTTALLNLYLLILIERKVLLLGWSWLIVVGTLGTMGIGWWLGPKLQPKENS